MGFHVDSMKFQRGCESPKTLWCSLNTKSWSCMTSSMTTGWWLGGYPHFGKGPLAEIEAGNDGVNSTDKMGLNQWQMVIQLMNKPCVDHNQTADWYTPQKENMRTEPTWHEHIWQKKHVLIKCVWNNPWISLSTPCLETQVFGGDINPLPSMHTRICINMYQGFVHSYIPIAESHEIQHASRSFSCISTYKLLRCALQEQRPPPAAKQSKQSKQSKTINPSTHSPIENQPKTINNQPKPNMFFVTFPWCPGTPPWPHQSGSSGQVAPPLFGPGRAGRMRGFRAGPELRGAGLLPGSWLGLEGFLFWTFIDLSMIKKCSITICYNIWFLFNVIILYLWLVHGE